MLPFYVAARFDPIYNFEVFAEYLHHIMRNRKNPNCVQTSKKPKKNFAIVHTV